MFLGTVCLNVTIVSNTFNNDQKQIDAFYNDTSANTLLVSGNTHNGVGIAVPIDVTTDETASATVTIEGNTISSPAGKGIDMVLGDGSSVTTVVSNNTFPSVGSGSNDNAISLRGISGQTPTLNALIVGNTFGTSGSIYDAGLRIEGNGGAATFNVVVDGNDFAKTNSGGVGAALEIVAETATINVDIRGNTIGNAVGAATGILLDADSGGAGTINIEDSTPDGNSGPNTDIGEATDNNTFNHAGTPVSIVETTGSVNYTFQGNPVNVANIPVLLGNSVWNDLNNNGIQDGGGEIGLVGVRVTLSGAASGIAFTDGAGQYLFSAIPGAYTLAVTPPGGFVFSPKEQLGDPTVDSNFDTGTGQAAVTILASTEDLTIDAGLNDTILAISLGFFQAKRTGKNVSFEWQTVTEIGTAGFYLLAEEEQELRQLNPELIPSKVINSVVSTDYDFAASTDANIFYLEEVDVSGATSRHGPFVLGDVHGVHTDPDSNDSIELFLPTVVR
jgi:hypothetical protein